MYCGRDLSYGKTHNLKATFEKEHSIERKQATKEYDFLKHCKYNLGVSCSACNKLKKEKLIFLPRNILNTQTLKKCLLRDCSSRCSFYSIIYNKYCTDNKFLLMPDSLSLSNNIMQIEYDLLNREYQPSSLYSYTSEEEEILNNYIYKLDLKERNSDVLAGILVQLETILSNNIDIKSMRLRNGSNNLYNNVLDEFFYKFLLKFDIETQKVIVTTLYKIYVVN